jgi:hypothetical protein
LTHQYRTLNHQLGRRIMTRMNGTVAITDHGWYRFLLVQDDVDEVNFWTPSAHWGFRGEVGAPFLFKLKARYDHAICGFAHFARYSRLPDWLAWETFAAKNGCLTLESMRERIGGHQGQDRLPRAIAVERDRLHSARPADVLSTRRMGRWPTRLASGQPATQAIRPDRG